MAKLAALHAESAEPLGNEAEETRALAMRVEWAKAERLRQTPPTQKRKIAAAAVVNSDKALAQIHREVQETEAKIQELQNKKGRGNGQR